MRLVFVNCFVWLYAEAYDWKMPEDVIKAWLAATFVEPVSVVYVVVSHLFPKR